MVFKLRTSKETMTIFEEIGLSLHLQPFALCKIAIALSLRVDDKLVEDDFKTNSDGISEDDYFPKYMKAHIDRGATLLYSEFKYSGTNFYKHVLELDKSL